MFIELCVCVCCLLLVLLAWQHCLLLPIYHLFVLVFLSICQGTWKNVFRWVALGEVTQLQVSGVHDQAIHHARFMCLTFRITSVDGVHLSSESQIALLH